MRLCSERILAFLRFAVTFPAAAPQLQQRARSLPAPSTTHIRSHESRAKTTIHARTRIRRSNSSILNVVLIEIMERMELFTLSLVKALIEL